MFFLPQSGVIVCGECVGNYPPTQIRQPLTRGVLTAMRHIVYVETGRLFAFSLPQPALERLGEIIQEYTLCQIEKRLDTLDFYLSVHQPLKRAEASAGA